MRFVTLGMAIGIAFAGFVSAEENVAAGWADTNVRVVQEKLRDAGLYFGEIDGAYSSELAAALGRYQIRNGLPITGQLDEETSKALGAKPAVTTTADDRTKSSETWRRLRMGEQQTSTNPQPARSPQPSVTSQSTTEIPPQPAPAVTADVASDRGAMRTERLRDYIGAFVLAGLDQHVGSETEFFADRVEYYNEGVIDREKIRKDLQRYAARWPDRRFWLSVDDPRKGEHDERRRSARRRGRRSPGRGLGARRAGVWLCRRARKPPSRWPRWPRRPA